jgi:DNA-binding response OmpR family regulator
LPYPQSPYQVVKAPNGDVITPVNLPNQKARWVIGRKATLVAAIRGGIISTEEASARYGISSSELDSWKQSFDQDGMVGLKVTKMRRRIIREVPEETPSFIEYGDIIILPDSRRVDVYGAPVILGRKEYEAFELLCISHGTVVTKDMMLNYLYTNPARREPCMKMVDVLLHKLRKKIVAACGKDCIETIWGRGYRIP